MISSPNEIDRVTYPDLPADTSFARYQDGLATFVFNPFPDIGGINLDNGARKPSVGRPILDPTSLSPDTPLKFLVKAEDDTGIVSLSIAVQRLDDRTIPPFRIPLFDDGMHDDGVAGDTIFGGTYEPGLPSGAPVEFYIEAVSLDGSSIAEPGAARFTLPDRPIEGYDFGFAGNSHPAAGIQISEVVSLPNGEFPAPGGVLVDWLEFRNTGTSEVDLAGVGFTQQLFGGDEGDTFTFPESGGTATSVLASPGATTVIFSDADDEIAEIAELPFKISASGEDLFTTVLDPATGARLLIDFLNVPPLQAGESVSRLGTSGLTQIGTPTPGVQNLSESILPLPLDEQGSFNLFFRTDQGSTVILESSTDAIEWEEVLRRPGGNIEEHFTDPEPNGTRLFRVRNQ